MTPYIALLRAVNVGGVGALPMTRLKGHCHGLGFLNAATYLASGNVVFLSLDGEAAIKSKLQAALVADLGPLPQVVVRTAAEMAAVLCANPFPTAPPARVVAIFLDAEPPSDLLQSLRGRTDETIVAGEREIYVHYPSGQGASKLRLPAAETGTARNVNTIARLAAMAAALR